MHVFTFTFAVNHLGFCIFFCLISMTKFLCPLVPPSEVRGDIYCISLCLHQFFCPYVCFVLFFFLVTFFRAGLFYSFIHSLPSGSTVVNLA